MPQGRYIDADTLRTALLDQIVTLESIECSYAYCCNKRAEEQLDRLDMRWKNGWLWYASRPSNPSDHPHALKHVIESIVDGAVSGYWEESASGRCYHHTNYERLRFMAYNELSPLTILGVSSPHSYYSYAANFREMLESTVTPHVMIQDHQTLLY
ncbi:MAG TPA: hypothetical protein ENN29_02275, partial [Candidatus Hydrogenedentes bacterium]|nr:hypothetical protein [Candidatus Hydrogenedentota bacterium]